MTNGLGVRVIALCWVGLVGCGDEAVLDIQDPEICLSRRDGVRYCIEVYEASREDATDVSGGTDEASPARARTGRLPWTNITWAAARTACAAKDKRLCDLDEWVDACDGLVGDGGTVYTYGDIRDESNMTCNTGSAEVAACGALADCQSAKGTFDQSGNIWEWTGNTRGAATARGGGFRSTQTHACDSTLMNIDLDGETSEVGFRCCRDL